MRNNYFIVIQSCPDAAPNDSSYEGSSQGVF